VIFKVAQRTQVEIAGTSGSDVRNGQKPLRLTKIGALLVPKVWSLVIIELLIYLDYATHRRLRNS
jgi:hypothetical protein